jgi:S1-C subfamily serine protease
MLGLGLPGWGLPGRTARAADLGPVDAEALKLALLRAQHSVVGLQAEAIEEARSSRTLGDTRTGSGVVIGADGLVVTIGYLILEAEQVDLVTADGQRIPARVVGYDMDSGFGLVQALVPMAIEAAPIGRADALAAEELLMFAHGGEVQGIAPTWLLSRRPFAGTWEYHIEQALFTSPPWPMHSGAGLFNRRGELVGIGSLRMSDAGEIDGEHRPGNMFVPVDLLLPILDELRRSGTTARSRRAWLGLNCVESDDTVRVVRVSADSPAEVAGLQVGDIILRIDAQEVRALDGLWRALWRGGPPEREVRLEIQRGATRQEVKVFSVDRMKTLKRPTGV